MKHVRLIMNPVSGTDEPNPMKLPDIMAALEAEDIRAELVFTSQDKSPMHIAQQAAAEGYDMVIVGGGDGTVSEVAKGLVNAPIPLGIVPIGTYNNIARSLNLPMTLPEACQVLARGEIKSVDIGLANDEHYFFEAGGVGLDATLFPLGEEIKGGRWGRMFQAFRLAMGYQSQKVKIELDRPLATARTHPPLTTRFLRRKIASKHEFRTKALLVVVANTPYYGAGFMVAPNAIVDDGLLSVTIYRKFSKWELIRHFWSISRGEYHYNPNIETYQVSRVRISSNAQLPVHVDGHLIGEVPVTFQVLKQALKVILPVGNIPSYQPQDDLNPPVALPADSNSTE
jgi:diacylglycerol kinase (ATP)